MRSDGPPTASFARTQCGGQPTQETDAARRTILS